MNEQHKKYTNCLLIVKECQKLTCAYLLSACQSAEVIGISCLQQVGQLARYKKPNFKDPFSIQVAAINSRNILS